jgi:hypothetical protein
LNEAEELAALIDAHDALVRAVIAGDLTFAEFVAAYGDFPSHGLNIAKASPDGDAVLRRFRTRMEFHRQVSGVLAGIRSGQSAMMSVPDAAAGYLDTAAFHRLRQLVSRYPDFKAESGVSDEQNAALPSSSNRN